jgi:hypothetical protein
VLTCLNVGAGLCGGLLFDTWFFSSSKHSLVKAASSWVTQGSAVPNKLAQTIKQKQGYLWYACHFPSSTNFCETYLMLLDLSSQVRLGGSLH